MYSPRFIRCVLNVLSITNSRHNSLQRSCCCFGPCCSITYVQCNPLFLDNHTHLRSSSSLSINRRNPALTNALPYSSDDFHARSHASCSRGAWAIPQDAEAGHQLACAMRLKPATVSLRERLALDAVEAAVTILENDPTFDAVRAAFYLRWPRPA